MKKFAIPTVMIVVALAAGYLFRRAITAPSELVVRNLTALNGTTAGTTTEAELVGKPPYDKLTRECYGERCWYNTDVDNFWLSRLHLAPYTHVRSTVTVTDGLVKEVTISAWSAPPPVHEIIQQAILPKDCEASPCFLSLVTPDKRVMKRRIVFPSASELRNHVDMFVNAGCLSRFKGCSTQELLPVLKQLGASFAH